jgi:uncharacterized Zn finger protein (UPF0148 family)
MSDSTPNKQESVTEVRPLSIAEVLKDPRVITRECRRCKGPNVRARRTGKRPVFCTTCEKARVVAQRAAGVAVRMAIKRGELQPAHTHTCVDCGAQAVGYEHRDYSKPLEVDPICDSCNYRRGPAIWSSK